MRNLKTLELLRYGFRLVTAALFLMVFLYYMLQGVDTYKQKEKPMKLLNPEGNLILEPAQLLVPPTCIQSVETFLLHQRANLSPNFLGFEGFSSENLHSGALRIFNVELKDFLPNDPPSRIMDIGCGLALYDSFVLKHYLYNVSLYLVDKSTSDVLEKDFKKKSVNFRENANEFAFYTNIECAVDILSLNGPKEKVDIHSIDATTESLNALEYETFDVIYSLLSWGFHYSTRTYAAVSYKLLRNNGILILTIRKPVKSKIADLHSVGFSCKIVSKINRQQIKYSKQYRSKYDMVKCIKNT